MSDYAIIYQVLGVLLVLFFGFITYMNTKTWRWPHVTMLFLVFAMVPTFWVYAAMVIKTRAAWMNLYQKLDDEVKRYEESVALLQRGEENDVKAERDSVYAKSEELSRLILDRGRVWRNCIPAGVAGGSITLNMPAGAAPPPPPAPMPMPVDPAVPVDPAAPVDPDAPVDPAADPAADPMPMPMPMPEPAGPVGGHNIVEKMVLYAFKEIDNPQLGFKQPSFYLGEFFVTATTPTTISIAPTMPLAPDQLVEVNQGQATWMLFETCPIDTYEIFAGLDANTLSQIIPQAETGLAQPEYTALLNSIVQDGQPAENAPPENAWIEVRFTKAHKEEVDAPTANDAPDEMPFDNSGLAQPGRLRRLESDLNEFDPGDTAVLPQEKAEELVAAGVAEKIRNIYRRQLTEFSARLRSISRRKYEIDLLLVEVRRDISTLDAANVKANEQIALQTEHKRLLDEDLAKVTMERDGVSRYGRSLFSEVNKVNNEIKQLYVSNHALNLELRQLAAKLLEDANRRTREATASQ